MSETYLRAVGLETEFGVWSPSQPGANPIALSAEVLAAVAESQAKLSAAGQAIRWDYEGEDPLNDMRGTRLERASAHPSLLTDDPENFAPSGYATPSSQTFQTVDAATVERCISPNLVTVVCSNGARFYVDHAHPEYSAPEALSAREAVALDFAGDNLAAQACADLAAAGRDIVLYKNNTDGKGAAYGSHENYQISRALPWKALAWALVPFLVSRPVICGAGRVGLGMKSQYAGFQISQRADFIADMVGLQTTFNRPIINSRDESHSGAAWRRLHVINGDANRFSGSVYAKVGATRAYLWALEALHAAGMLGQDGKLPPLLEDLLLDEDPVEACWRLSHDPNLGEKVLLHDESQVNLLDLQRRLLEVVNEVATGPIGADFGGMPAEIAAERDYWAQTLELLATDREKAARRVEWLGKYQLLEAMNQRLGGDWSNARIAALDIQWADLRPGASPVEKLAAKGFVEEIGLEGLARAQEVGPENGRGTLRALAVRSDASLRAAGWKSLILAGESYRRLDLGEANTIYSPQVLQAAATTPVEQWPGLGIG